MFNIRKFFEEIMFKLRQNKKKRKLTEYKNIETEAISRFDITEIKNERFLKIKNQNDFVLIPIEQLKDMSSTLNYLRECFIKKHLK